MKSSQLIREKLGLSQEVLAFYLGITKSLLAMYERGKREIPTIALVKLAEIELFLNQNLENTKEQNLLQKQQEGKVTYLLEQHRKELAYKQLVEKRKLDVLKKKYNQSLMLIAFVTQQEVAMSKSGELLQLQANKGIEKYGLVAQTIQLLKLEAINGQLVYCKRVKEKQKKS